MTTYSLGTAGKRHRSTGLIQQRSGSGAHGLYKVAEATGLVQTGQGVKEKMILIM